MERIISNELQAKPTTVQPAFIVPKDKLHTVDINGRGLKRNATTLDDQKIIEANVSNQLPGSTFLGKKYIFEYSVYRFIVLNH